MTWFKVDDTLAFHAKVVAAGNEAMGLWVRAGSWSSQQLTDGFVPDHMVAAMAGGGGGAERLVEVELWVREDDGYRFHQWEQAQPTREAVLAQREAERERKRRQRRKANGQFVESERSPRGVLPGVTPGDPEVVPEGVPPGVPEGVPAGHREDDHRESRYESHRPDPSRPDPTRPLVSTSSAVADSPPAKAGGSERTLEPHREDVEALCVRLREHIAANTDRPPNITQRWRTQARLLLDRDRIEFDEAMRVLDWCQQDSFWMPNILSMPTFREKFARLQIQSRQQQQQRQQPQRTWVDVARGMSQQNNFVDATVIEQGELE